MTERDQFLMRLLKEMHDEMERFKTTTQAFLDNADEIKDVPNMARTLIEHCQGVVHRYIRQIEENQ